MGKLFYSGVYEQVMRTKTYSKDKRKKVKLVTAIDRAGTQRWYIFVGTKLLVMFRKPKEAIAWYEGL